MSSAAKHHNEWLGLVETSGPFLSLPVLLEAFPHGLDQHDPPHFADLKRLYGDWLEATGSAAQHTLWCDWVLKETLGWPDDLVLSGQAVPASTCAHLVEEDIHLRPDCVLVRPTDRLPVILFQRFPAGQVLEAQVKASPATRMMELLHRTGVALGLITNGEHWQLVHAPVGEATGLASWYADTWCEEPVTLRAFRTLLGQYRLYGVADDESLTALYRRSSQHQHEVTEQLGLQVRRAVEILIHSVDHEDKSRNRELLKGFDEKVMYDAACTTMMRLVFLLTAEDRNMFPMDDDVFVRHYAVTPLVDQLRETADQHGEEVLDHRYEAWARLLATFRLVFAGIRHDRLQLPAYGGRLFDPDRFPFLEGRLPGTSWKETRAEPLPINDRTVLHLLESLQYLQVRVPGAGTERRRLSFRALDVEQIGHVYEGLLDHTAVRASSPVLGFVGPNEPEIDLPTIELQEAKGRDAVAEYLVRETGKSAKAVDNALGSYDQAMDDRLMVACDHDADLYGKVKPYSKLLRDDYAGYPVVYESGSVYVTEGMERRKTGTHYTPRALTEPIVKHALDPILYEHFAEGKEACPASLRSPREILATRVCDVACGSGAFLVQACRYLSERLVEAWERAERANPGKRITTPEGDLNGDGHADFPFPDDPEERLALARRLITDRCLYGVDKNPMAIEMAKLSLWLVTMQRARAFTFLDHALKSGDSLLGLTSLDQLEQFNLEPSKQQQQVLLARYYDDAIKQAISKRLEIEHFPVIDIEDARRKAQLLKEADQSLEDLRTAADLLLGTALRYPDATGDNFATAARPQREALSAALKPEPGTPARKQAFTALAQKARILLDEGKPTALSSRRPFHWALEFPEMFSNASGLQHGFSAIVCNPPFQGGQKITGALGDDYRSYLVTRLASGRRGSADLTAYFVLRSHSLLRKGGCVGFIATNTISQGDTREVGLEQLNAIGGTIYRALPSIDWPGAANVRVALVWAHKGPWAAKAVLDDQPYESITPYLTPPGKVAGKPERLAANAGKCFQGVIILGLGFTMEPQEAKSLIARDVQCSKVLQPYLNGEDLNQRPDQSPSRWVINFHDWGLAQAEGFPELLAIVRDRVKPERDTNKRAQRRDYWWRYAERCTGLYGAIRGLPRVLVVSVVTHHVCFAFQPTDIVFANRLYVFALPRFCDFALLQSNLHEVWTRKYSSQLETRLNYAPTDCFETFPFPTCLGTLEKPGERYYACRDQVMKKHAEGLTDTYNRVHRQDETSAEYGTFRERIVELDEAVCRAYGWDDLKLGHGFHKTEQGMRFTFSPKARSEVMDRLLALNHERHEQEVAQGLVDGTGSGGKGMGKKSGTRKSRVKATAEKVATLFDVLDDEE